MSDDDASPEEIAGPTVPAGACPGNFHHQQTWLPPAPRKIVQMSSAQRECWVTKGGETRRHLIMD